MSKMLRFGLLIFLIVSLIGGIFFIKDRYKYKQKVAEVQHVLSQAETKMEAKAYADALTLCQDAVKKARTLGIQDSDIVGRIHQLSDRIKHFYVNNLITLAEDQKKAQNFENAKPFLNRVGPS